MANYAFGLLLVLIIIVLALWARDTRLTAAVAGALVALCAAAFVASTRDVALTDGKGSSVIAGGATDLAAVPDNLALVPAASKPVTRIDKHATTKQIIKDVFRLSKKGVVSLTAAGATAGSGGLGGDTVVDVLAVVLDSALWLGQMSLTFANSAADCAPTLARIWALDFANGVDGVGRDMAVIVREMGGPTSAMFTSIRAVFNDTIDWLLSMLGSAISVAIPNDSGLTGFGISETLIYAIRFASQNTWWIAQTVYNSLPDVAKGVLQKPEGLADVAIYALESIEKYLLHGDDDKWWTTIGKSLGRNAGITMAAFGVLLLNPVLMFPVASTIFMSGQIANAFYTAGIGNKAISAALRSLYTQKIQIAGFEPMTAVEAMVMFMRKITVVAFAGLYILSDNTVALPPPDWKLEFKSKTDRAIVAPSGAIAAQDPVNKMIDTVVRDPANIE